MLFTVSAVTEFNRFYTPELTRPPVTLLPSSTEQRPPPPQPEQPEPTGGDRDRDPEPTRPPIDPAMFRLPFPGSERMKTDEPTIPMEQEESGAAARPQGWLSECPWRYLNF